MAASSRLQQTLLILALASIYPLQAGAATPAGIAQFIAGDVSVRGADGKINALQKGKDIESGQAIVTGANGRAQVRFSDGGMVSLQPNTEFKLANYVDKGDPKEDRFLVDFLSGSMRAVTGLIGKRNRANYKIFTATSTIGIRGSSFTASYNVDGSMIVTAEKDGIEVCSGGVCVGLIKGESVRVTSSSEPPKRTTDRAGVPTPGPAQATVTVGNQTTSDGKSILVLNQALAQAPTGTFTNLQVSAVFELAPGLCCGITANGPSSPTSLVAGKLTSFSNASTNFTPNSTGAATSIGSVAGGDFVGWGTWLTGTITEISPPPPASSIGRLHYVVGIPTGLMPVTGTAAYSLIGSTAPTRADGAAGSLTSATFSVDFSPGGVVSASLVNTFGLSTFTTAEASITRSGSSFQGSAISGNFFGANAARAGLVYIGFDTDVGQAFSGSAVFQK